MAADISMQVNNYLDNSTSDSVEMDLDESLLPKVDPLAVVTEERMTGPSYDVVPHPRAEVADFSELRGVAKMHGNGDCDDNDADLENLAELVPDIKARRSTTHEEHEHGGGGGGGAALTPSSTPKVLDDSGNGEEEAVEVVETNHNNNHNTNNQQRRNTMQSRKASLRNTTTANDNLVHRVDSMRVQQSMDLGEQQQQQQRINKPSNHTATGAAADPSSNAHRGDSTSFDDGDYTGSDQALEDDNNNEDDVTKMPKEFVNMGAASSAQSISTATQTHEVVRVCRILFMYCMFISFVYFSCSTHHLLFFPFPAHAHVLAHLQARHGVHQRLGFHCALFCRPLALRHYRRQTRTFPLVQIQIAHPTHSPRRSLPLLETRRRRTHLLQATTQTRPQHLPRGPARLVSRSPQPNVHGHAHTPPKVRSRQRPQEFRPHFQTAHRRHYRRHGRSVQGSHGGIFGALLSTPGGQPRQ